LAFFEKAFGLKRKFVHESGTYGELDTGETALAFAAHELGAGSAPVTAATIRTYAPFYLSERE
jgi:lactoylglutathione lyase